MSSSTLISTLERAALRANLRHQLWSQDTWWVPEVGWDALVKASIAVTVTEQLAPAAGPVAVRGSRRTHVWARLDLAALDAAAGEKVLVTEMGTAHRRNVLRFIERQVPGVLHGLYWDIPSDPFGGEVPGEVLHEHEQLLDVLHDPARRTAWFAALPLVVALRAAINGERDARLPHRPVLLGT